MESKIEKMIDMVEEFYRQIEDTGYLYKGKEMTKDRKEELEKLFKEEYTEYKTARRLDGKVMKGPDYFPPNLKQFL